MVTGVSSGIGLATASALSAMGFHIVGAGRDHQRSRAAVESIGSSGGSVEFLELDLSSLESCRRAAADFSSSGRSIDVLINNAGVGPVKGTTADGFEIHFGVNHLGHFLLTHELQQAFLSGTRIVQVSSQMHHRVRGIDFDSLKQRTKSFYGLDEYATSKLANILFVRELARRRPELRTYAIHPGLVRTRIIPWYVRPLVGSRALSPEDGADTVVWCATAPELAERSGLYYARRSVAVPSAAGVDDDLAAQLWEYSEQACGPPQGR